MRGRLAGKTKSTIEVTAEHLRRAGMRSLGTISKEIEAMVKTLERVVAKSDLDKSDRSGWARDDIESALDQVLTSIARVTPEELGGCRKQDLFLNIGAFYESMGMTENAFDCYLGSLTTSRREITPHDKASIELKVGRILCGQADWPAAERYLGSALETYKEAGSKTGAIRALTLLGKVYYQQGKHYAARKKIDEGVTLAKEIGDRKSAADLCNIMGLVYSLAGEHGNSLCSFQDALISYQRIYDFRGVAEVYHNIARVHIRQRRITEAASSCDKSLIMCEQTSNFSLLPFVLLTKAEIAWENEDYIACASFCRKGMEMVAGWGGPLVLAKVNRILGDLIARAMSFDYAEPFYEHGGEIYAEHHIRAGEAWVHMASARSLEEEGLTSRCIKHLEAALAIYREIELDKDAASVASKIAALKELTPTIRHTA